jgi:hypothetical protein
VTLAFEEFMRQYKMTGSEKADGYSRNVFIGLDGREKEIVFGLLESELPWAAEWFFFLDSEKALVVAKEKEAELRRRGYGDAYLLQDQMIKYSGNLIYQEHMIEDYPNYHERVKPLVVDAINRTPVNAATVSFFKQIILADVNRESADRASMHLLDAIKIPKTTENEKKTYRWLLNELRSESIRRKLNAIAKIEKIRTVK